MLETDLKTSYTLQIVKDKNTKFIMTDLCQPKYILSLAVI